jgi:hypothetical protein
MIMQGGYYEKDKTRISYGYGGSHDSAFKRLRFQ